MGALRLSPLLALDLITASVPNYGSQITDTSNVKLSQTGVEQTHNASGTGPSSGKSTTCGTIGGKLVERQQNCCFRQKTTTMVVIVV